MTKSSVGVACPVPECGEQLNEESDYVCMRCGTPAAICDVCSVANRSDALYCRGCRTSVVSAALSPDCRFGGKERLIGHLKQPGSAWSGRPIWHAGVFWAMESSGNLLRISPLKKGQVRRYEIAGEMLPTASELAPLGVVTFKQPMWLAPDSTIDAVHGPTLFAASKRNICSVSLATAALGVDGRQGLNCRVHFELPAGHTYLLDSRNNGEFGRLAMGLHGLGTVVIPESGRGVQLTVIGWARGATDSAPLGEETRLIGPAAAGDWFAAPGDTGLWIAQSSAIRPLAFQGRIPYPRDFKPFLMRDDLSRAPSVKLRGDDLPFAICESHVARGSTQPACAIIHVLGLWRDRPAVWSATTGGEDLQPVELVHNSAVSVTQDGRLLVHHKEELLCFGGALRPERIHLTGRQLRLGFPVEKAGSWIAGFQHGASDTISLFDVSDAKNYFSIPFSESDLSHKESFGFDMHGAALTLWYRTAEPSTTLGLVNWKVGAG